MSNVFYRNVEASMPELRLIAGHFQLNGTSNPDNQKGRLFSVTRTDVGKFLITFTQKYQLMFPAGAPGLQVNGDDQDIAAHWGTIDPDASGGATAVLYVQDSAVDADIDDAIVSFVMAVPKYNINMNIATP